MAAAVRGRRQTYTAILGIALGSLVTGLVLPFAVGESASDTVVTAGASDFAADPSEPDEGFDAGVGTTETGEDLSGSAEDPVATTVPASEDGAAAPAAPSEAPADPAPGSPRTANLTASDIGVSPTTVKLGVVLLDLATARSVGLAPENYTVEDQRRAYEVFLGQVNDAGGVNGRKVKATYAVADPFDNSSAQSACLKLTRDEKVFAVLSVAGFRGTASLCITRDNKTPLVAQGHHPQEYFQASGGRLVTDQASSERTADMYIRSLDRMGVLKGKTLGLVTNQDATNGEKQGGDAVAAALQAHGYRVARRANLSADLPTGASQIPVEVQQMRAAGVDTVVLATNFLYSTQFAQAADGQGWRPAYTAGQIGDMTSDALARNMPDSYDGAIAITSNRYNHDARAGRPEPAVERKCREYYNAKTGANYPYGGENPVLAACAGVGIFRTAASAAGPELTRGRYVAAMQQRGAFAWPGMIGGSLGPNKFDYADQVRPLRWKASCRCYHVAD